MNVRYGLAGVIIADNLHILTPIDVSNNLAPNTINQHKLDSTRRRVRFGTFLIFLLFLLSPDSEMRGNNADRFSFFCFVVIYIQRIISEGVHTSIVTSDIECNTGYFFFISTREQLQ